MLKHLFTLAVVLLCLAVITCSGCTNVADHGLSHDDATSQSGSETETPESSDSEGYDIPPIPAWSEPTLVRRDPWDSIGTKQIGTWYIPPTYDFDDMLLFDYAPDCSPNHSDANTRLPQLDAEPEDYLRLSFYKKDGRVGLINQHGEFVSDPQYDVIYCELCGFTENNTEYEKMQFGPRGETRVFSAGHSGGPGCFYDEATGDVIGGVNMSPLEHISFPFSGTIPAVVVKTQEDPDKFYDGNNMTHNPLTISDPREYVFIDTDRFTLAFDERFSDFRSIPDSKYNTEFWKIGNDYGWEWYYTAIDKIPVKTMDGCWKFIDCSGKDLGLGTYEDALPFHEGVAAVKQDGKWGYINETGTVVAPFVYEDASSVYDSLAWVKKDGLWGVAVIFDNAGTGGTVQ